MERKLLYLDIDGVLVGKARPDDVRVGLAKHAGEFLEFCLQHFECFWLSTHCPDGDAAPAVRVFARYADDSVLALVRRVGATSWRRAKIEAIDLGSDFYWVEDKPAPLELSILESHGVLNRLIHVDTRREPDGLQRAMSLLREAVAPG
jgi:hypothetical protein